MATVARIPVSLEITSDTICPFCYLGHKRIEKAIEEAKALDLPLDFDIRFSPYLLDPTLKESPGENKKERYARKFGSAEKVEQMHKSMIQQGLSEGINFSFGGNVSQTTRSHRLFAKARELKGEEGQLKVVRRVMVTYFEEEGDPGSYDLLSRDAVSSGIFETKEEALKFLESDELLKEVQAGIVKSQQRGISGVPFTLINDKFGVSGAQDSDTWVSIFKRIADGELK